MTLPNMRALLSTRSTRSSKDAPTPVRARRIDTPEQRVSECLGLIHSNEWIKGVTGPRLAEEWGMPVSTVQNASSEAFRRYRAQIQDPDFMRLEVGENHRALMRLGRQRYEDGMDADDGRISLQAGDLLAKIAGANAAVKVEVSVEAMRFDALPTQQKAQQLRQLAAQMIQDAEALEVDFEAEV